MCPREFGERSSPKALFRVNKSRSRRQELELTPRDGPSWAEIDNKNGPAIGHFMKRDDPNLCWFHEILKAARPKPSKTMEKA